MEEEGRPKISPPSTNPRKCSARGGGSPARIDPAEKEMASTPRVPQAFVVAIVCFQLCVLLFHLVAYGQPISLTSAPSGISLPPELLFEKSCKKLFASADSTHWNGGCECVAVPRRMGKGAKCCCVGQSVELIVDSIGIHQQQETGPINRIFVFNASLTHLDAHSFRAFPHLEEIFIDSCLQLQRVESQAFSGLKTLRKIRISACPSFRDWEGPMLLSETPRLQTIIAKGNGLRQLPSLKMEATAQQNAVMPMERLDFSDNCIGQIGSNAMHNVAAKTVLLNGNGPCLRAIHANAFSGCRFVTLQLSDNPRLDQLHADSFAGLLHLDHLDLSRTAIGQLPASGLAPLKRLTLRDVPQLKQLPPVLAFPNLVQAEFTYSHHCCFFKYASRDFYTRKGSQINTKDLEQNYREVQRRVCAEQQQQQGDKNMEEDIGPDRRMRREKRHVFIQDGGDTLFKELAEWYRNVELQPLGASTADGVHRDLVNGSFSDDELEPFIGDQLGKGFVLTRKCDRNAVDRFYLNISCTPQPDALNPCEDIVSNLPLRIIIWPMWLGAIFGNLAVWAVISAAWQKKMRLHYLFMLNLSLADFLTGVYLAMLAVTDLRTANEYYNYAVEWQTGGGCALAGFLSVFASQLSIFSMLMIALEIFYNSRFAFYGRRLSSTWAGFALCLGYIYSLGMASLPLLGISSYQHSSICLPLHIQTGADKLYILVGLSLSGVAFATMVFLYGLLNCTLRRSKASSTTRAEEDRQILRRTLVLIGTDMLCWVPTLFFGLTAALSWPLITLSSAKWCLVLFYPINSCANPLLYVFLTRTWRDAKRKAGPLIRRSLETNAAKTMRGTLSWNKLERFYSNGPKSGEKRRGSARRAGEDEEGMAAEEEERPSTIHCCDRGERKKLLGEIFAELGGGKGSKGMGRRDSRLRRASEGDGTENAAKRKSSLNLQTCPEESNKRAGLSNSSTPRRKSLLPRLKISAPPQMSDISESSTASLGASSSLHQHHSKGTDTKETISGNFSASMPEKRMMTAMANRNLEEAASPKRRGKRESIASSNVDGDSGRGDSLRSWAKSARPSVITICWEGTADEKLLSLAKSKCSDADGDGTDEEGNVADN